MEIVRESDQFYIYFPVSVDTYDVKCDGLDPEGASIFLISENIVGCQGNAEKLLMRHFASPGSRNQLYPHPRTSMGSPDWLQSMLD